MIPTHPACYGLSQLGYVSVQKAYEWDPGTLVSGITDSNIAGVEATSWSDTRPPFTWIEIHGLAEAGGRSGSGLVAGQRAKLDRV